MPQTQSMRKRLRQSHRRRQRNLALKTRAKAARRAVVDNLGAANAEESREHLRLAQKAIDKAARRGAIHPRTASRRKSKLARQVAEKA